jgi:NAD(P)-dependent dehydrogenase (short-subunit alcohol dehydrogenase family)
MGCRSQNKCTDAANELKAKTKKNLALVTMILDTSSLESSKRFSDTFKSKYDRLDIAVFNAGIAVTQGLQLSADGIEMIFATAQVGHFLIFRELQSIIEKTSKQFGAVTLTHISSATNFNTLELPSPGVFFVT